MRRSHPCAAQVLDEDFRVFVNDKTKEWSVGAAPFEGKAKFDKPFRRRGGGGLTAADAEIVANAVDRRDSAKRDRAFKLADALRDELRKRFKVEIDDGHREWRVDTGNRFVRAWDSPPPSDEPAVIALIADRGRAKSDRRYNDADAIRDELFETYAVRVDDRLHEYIVVDSKLRDARPPRRAGAEDAVAEVAGAEVAGADAQLPESHGAEDADATLDLATLTVPILKERLKERGLKVGGKKAELIERLLASS